jgi:predicted pyridoxine 5'-phosphate oxidase superfamily flavin-nucleotide-binding protein
MAEMSKELMELINSVPCCYWATASKDGTPNVAAVGTTTAVSPDIIVAAGIFLGKTLDNLKQNPKVAVIVTSVAPAPSKAEMTLEKYAQVTGAQIKGSVTLMTSGDIHEQIKSGVARVLGAQVAQMIKETIALKVEEIYSVSAVEPGKRIA